MKMACSFVGTLLSATLTTLLVVGAQADLGHVHAQAAHCTAPAQVPPDREAAWCRIASQRGAAKAHLVLGMELALDKKRPKEALPMLEAAAALGEGEASVWVGIILIAGGDVEVDKLRATSAFETAALAGEERAFYFLEGIYGGSYGAELRDPMKRAMWLFARRPILGERSDDYAMSQARGMGLADADIAEVRRRVHRLITEKKVVRRDVLCEVAADVPRIEDVMWAWCGAGRTGNLRKAYNDAGRLLWTRGQAEEGLRMFTRAGELGNLEALVNVALYTAQGTGAPRDFPRAIALLEDAYRRGAALASGWLILVYEGSTFRGAAHARDPMKATMWRFIPFVAADMTDLSPARAYGKEMGLTDDDVGEAQRRAVAWVADNMQGRRYRATPRGEFPDVFDRRQWEYFFPVPPGEQGLSR